MNKNLIAFLLIGMIAFGYVLSPKTTTILLDGPNSQPYKLSYTGLGIRGAGFFGFQPRGIVYSGPSGYDAGTTTVTITPAAGGWLLREQGEKKQLRAYGFITGSTQIGRGIFVPDLKHHLNASYFYSPNGSMTGSIYKGSGEYDIITTKFIHHVKVSGGTTIISESSA